MKLKLYEVDTETRGFHLIARKGSLSHTDGDVMDRRKWQGYA